MIGVLLEDKCTWDANVKKMHNISTNKADISRIGHALSVSLVHI